MSELIKRTGKKLDSDHDGIQVIVMQTDLLKLESALTEAQEENKRMYTALKNLLTACECADQIGDLSDLVKGVLMDNAREALNGGKSNE
jgi:hypothetical protein